MVVWECSFSLAEMQDYIAKVRGHSDTSSKAQASEKESESMDTTDAGREGEELQESSDECMRVRGVNFLEDLFFYRCS